MILATTTEGMPQKGFLFRGSGETIFCGANKKGRSVLSIEVMRSMERMRLY